MSLIAPDGRRQTPVVAESGGGGVRFGGSTGGGWKGNGMEGSRVRFRSVCCRVGKRVLIGPGMDLAGSTHSGLTVFVRLGLDAWIFSCALWILQQKKGRNIGATSP
jgi:hypothetical protein